MRRIDTSEDRSELRERLARANTSALRARLSGDLMTAAEYQRDAVKLHRWIQATA